MHRLQTHPAPSLRSPYPGGGGYMVETPQEPSRPQEPPTCQISSISVQQFWISLENIHIHCPPCPLGFQKTCLLKFDFGEILFYKYCTILNKKNYLPPGPILNTRNSDLGPKSKIGSNHFVCLVKCFPK